MTTILVTGATGRVGRHVVPGLLEAGVDVRALVRNPALAGLPPEVEVAQGDIYDPAAVSRAAAGVDAAFLLWPSFTADGAAEIVTALTKQVRRLVYLSSMSVSDTDPAASGVWGELEVLLTDAGADRTFIRPGGFAANTLEWADQIRSGDLVRIPSPTPAAPSSTNATSPRSQYKPSSTTNTSVRPTPSPAQRSSPRPTR
jgi:uncharacterized protein YbjT (DUF2867 family)